VNETPMLFTADMMRALLDGRKTQTRRLYKTRKHPDAGCEIAAHELVREPQHVIDRACPYGGPGDIIWTREAVIGHETPEGLDGVQYVADGAFRPIEKTQEAADQWLKLHTYRGKRGAQVPNIHMPRWARRILLEITGVRIERLQDISDVDAIAEGIGLNACAAGVPMTTPAGETIPRAMYRCLWESINGAGSWDANPWVWVIDFKRRMP